MKKLIYLLGLIYLGSCTENQITRDDMPSLLSPFKVFFQENSYSIQSKSDLEAFTSVATGLKQVQVLEARIEEMEDETGMFYAIRAEYYADGRHAIVVIPLDAGDEAAKTENAHTYYAECTMTCTAGTGSTQYNHIIYERCKKQSCSCSEENRGCTSSMTF